MSLDLDIIHAWNSHNQWVWVHPSKLTKLTPNTIETNKITRMKHACKLSTHEKQDSVCVFWSWNTKDETRVTHKRLATHHGIIPQIHKITQTMFTLNWVPTIRLNYEKLNSCNKHVTQFSLLGRSLGNKQMAFHALDNLQSF
jgi:hypothetical protein